MKKLFISNNGQVILKEVRKPFIETKGSIVETSYALISSGTELATINNMKFANQSIFKKLLGSKKFRKLVFLEVKKRGIVGTIKFVKSYFFKKEHTKNFSDPSHGLFSIGYSCSGVVRESNIKGYNIGDRVGCGGSNHAELIYSSKNLTCKIPENVSLEEAAFATLGAIALHGIHRANIEIGENIGVIGTGMIGLITVQLLKTSGCKVFAFDLINRRLNLAKKLGADYIINPRYYNSENSISKLTNNNGLDSIIICATSQSPKILEDAVELIRLNGKIVMLGAFPININRAKLYYKEADLLISRSYGPGRHDDSYEYEGFDYPEEYVPWTEKRNMELFLRLISQKKVNVKALTSDIILAENANEAYKKLNIDPIKNISILLKFSAEKNHKNLEKLPVINKSRMETFKIGLIGCGSFAQGTHLPHLLSNQNCKIKGICTQHDKSAQICKDKYYPEYVTTNPKKIINDTEIKTVFIYTRHNTHYNFTIDALKAGKNVYCEKPMALTMEQCKEIFNEVLETGKLYTLGFNRRYSVLIQKTKELIKRKNPIIINYRISSTFIHSKSWIYDPKVGGGPFIGELCHFTDLVLYLMNSDPIELKAIGGNLSHKNIESYDNCAVIIKFRDGSIANIIYSDLNGPKMPKERIEIFSGGSAIIIEDFIKIETSGFDVGNIVLPIQDKGHKNEIDAFIKSNLKGNKSLINVKDAIKAMEMCFKIIESIKLNKTINDFEWMS